MDEEKNDVLETLLVKDREDILKLPIQVRNYVGTKELKQKISIYNILVQNEKISIDVKVSESYISEKPDSIGTRVESFDVFFNYSSELSKEDFNFLLFYFGSNFKIIKSGKDVAIRFLYTFKYCKEDSTSPTWCAVPRGVLYEE